MEGEAQFNEAQLDGAAAIDGDATNVRGTRPSLLSLLIEAGVAPEQELRAAATAGMGAGERLGEIVLRYGWLDEPGLGQLIARQWSLPFLRDDAVVADQSRDDLLPLDQAENLGACPIVGEGGVLCVAVAEPATARLDGLRELVGREASFAVITPTTLARLLGERRRPVKDVPVGGDAIELEALMTDLTAATSRLATFRQRIVALTAATQAAEQELETSRRKLKELEQALAEERDRSRSLRGKLAALVDELDR